MRSGRGSSSGSSVLAEAIRAGTAPAAIVLAERDAILAVGAIVAAELYGQHCPVALVSAGDWEPLAAACGLMVEAGPQETAIRLLRVISGVRRTLSRSPPDGRGSACASSVFRSLPVAVCGRASTNTTSSGICHFGSLSRQEIEDALPWSAPGPRADGR